MKSVSRVRSPAPSWRVETRSRLPPPHSSTVWSMKWCRKPTARRAIPPDAALRIEVNGELDKLASTLPQAANRLHVGGRLVVESYHSLEDKTVKSFMAQGLRVDVPAGLPVIPPDAQPFFTDLTRGAIKADEHEIAANPRSASVRLRAVEVSREIPSRWRKRFTQTAQGLNDVKIQGSASPGRAKNTARIRTRRG